MIHEAEYEMSQSDERNSARKRQKVIGKLLELRDVCTFPAVNVLQHLLLKLNPSVEVEKKKSHSLYI